MSKHASVNYIFGYVLQQDKEKDGKKYANSCTCKALIDAELQGKINVFIRCSVIHNTVNTSIDLSMKGICHLKTRRQNIALVVGKIGRRFYAAFVDLGRFQLPHSLKRGSAAARLLGLPIEIPPVARIFVSCKCRVLYRQRSLQRPIQLPRAPTIVGRRCQTEKESIDPSFSKALLSYSLEHKTTQHTHTHTHKHTHTQTTRMGQKISS
jgi:hypothetical protein